MDLRRSDFEAMHPFAKLFNFDHEKLVYFGDGSDDTKRLNELWSTWCACIGLVHLEIKEAKVKAKQQFEVFLNQAIEDSACADERRSLQVLLDDFQDSVKAAQEQGHD